MTTRIDTFEVTLSRIQAHLANDPDVRALAAVLRSWRAVEAKDGPTALSFEQFHNCLLAEVDNAERDVANAGLGFEDPEWCDPRDTSVGFLPESPVQW